MRKPDENFDPMNLLIERPLRVGSGDVARIGGCGARDYGSSSASSCTCTANNPRSTALGKWPCRGLVEAIQ